MLFISSRTLFSFSKYLNFCFNFLVMQKNSLIRKIRLISKIFNVTLETIAIHILANISRSKGNQTIKCDQLIEHNMRNIFLEKSYTRFGGATIPRFLLRKAKIERKLSNVLRSLFLLHATLKIIQRY